MQSIIYVNNPLTLYISLKLYTYHMQKHIQRKIEGYTQIHTSNCMWGRKGNRIGKKIYFNLIYNGFFH